MRIPIVLTIGIVLLAVVTPSEAVYDDTFYVRADGNDTWCSGTADSAWNNISSPSNCAKKTITAGLALCDDEGDLLKIHSNTVEGVLYDEAPVVQDPNLTIEGYGGSGRPRIGELETFTSGWSYNATDDVYYRTYVSDANAPIWGAYLDLKYIGVPKNYEHERMTLAVHQDLADLKADPNALDPNTCTTSGPAPSNYYIGPGFNYNAGTDVLSVRLKATPEFTLYGSRYLDLGISDPNANLHRILISSSEHSLRVEAANVTLKNIQLEPARGALILDGADGLTVDNVVIWSGFAAAVLGRDTDSDDVTITNSRILHDTPYWIAWSDCKSSSGPCENQISTSGGMRDAMIEPWPSSDGWVIDHNLIRGGHDGIRSRDGVADWVISYNVLSDFHDDPFEIEGVGVGELDVHGNFITNSLNCFAVGQPVTGDPNTTDIDGPVYYYSNICALSRVPFVDRFRKNNGSCCYGDCKVSSWNGGRRYGNEGAFKVGPSAKKLNTDIYQNTVLIADSHSSAGIGFIGEDPNNMRDALVFNNMFLKLNGRVGPSDYETGATDKVVDWNLYWKINTDDDPNIDLLGSEDWVGDPNGALCGTYGFECNGVGGDPNNLHFGTNPVFHHSKLSSGYYEGLDCFGQECDGIDESTASRWTIKPGSEFMEPELFIPSGGSPACGAGRANTDPNWPAGLPNEHVINSLGELDAYDIGAVGCNIQAATDAWVSLWNSFPFNQIWTTSAMASAEAPVAVITEPSPDPNGIFEIMCPGGQPDLCGEKTDPDGGGPYTYSWTFEELAGGYNGPCPSTKTVLCPAQVTFAWPAECRVRLTVTDRWGKSYTDDETLIVRVLDECAVP